MRTLDMFTPYYPPTNVAEMNALVADENKFWHIDGVRVLKGVPVTLYFTSGAKAGNIVNVNNVHIFLETTWSKIAIKISEVAAIEVDKEAPPSAQALENSGIA